MKKSLQNLLVVFIAIALFGCKSYEDYKNERVESAIKHFDRSQYTDLPTDKVLSLKDCIELAIENNVDLKVYSLDNAINAPIQGTAADLIKIAMIQVDREMTKRQLKSKMLLQIHDELVFEVPQEEIEVMKELVTTIMNNAITMEVPLATDVNYGSSWFDAH